MANEGEIKINYPIAGLSGMTARISKPDNTIRDGQTAVVLDDDVLDNTYTNTGAITIEPGDTITPYLNGVNFGSAGTYQAMLAYDGFTVGGTMTLKTLFKIIAAFIKGTLRLKSGETKIYETLDADDNATVVLTSTLDGETSPFKEVV